jgi:hypothetical protein
MTIPARDTVADMFRRAVALELQTVDQAIGAYLQYFTVDEPAFLAELDKLDLTSEASGNLSLEDAIKIYLPKR